MKLHILIFNWCTPHVTTRIVKERKIVQSLLIAPNRKYIELLMFIITDLMMRVAI